jgi:hypothetical protein
MAGADLAPVACRKPRGPVSSAAALHVGFSLPNYGNSVRSPYQDYWGQHRSASRQQQRQSQFCLICCLYPS